MPDELLRRDGDEWRARHDYSAVELSCRAGQVLEGGEAVHGWVWCRAEDGGEGWVPRRNLAPAGRADGPA